MKHLPLLNLTSIFGATTFPDFLSGQRNTPTTGERYDCHAYTRNRDQEGNWEKFTTPITLDKKKKYIVAFLDKTRNDEDKQQVLYEANLSWNNWREIGYCSIKNEHVTTGR